MRLPIEIVALAPLAAVFMPVMAVGLGVVVGRAINRRDDRRQAALASKQEPTP